jgi:hypothetical protein
MLTAEQIVQIKSQIIDQIEKTFPENKKDSAIEKVESMNSEELEEFLKQNNLVKGDSSQCIFCSIVSEEIPSYKIGENEKAIAVLEINPISFGHSIIIPKNHTEKNSEEAKSLAKEIALRIKKLKPNKIDIFPSSMFGHQILNVLPIYEDETINSPRNKATEEELKSLSKTLSEEKIIKPKKRKEKKTEKTIKEKKPRKEKIKIEKLPEKLWLPKRIP